MGLVSIVSDVWEWAADRAGCSKVPGLGVIGTGRSPRENSPAPGSALPAMVPTPAVSPVPPVTSNAPSNPAGGAGVLLDDEDPIVIVAPGDVPAGLARFAAYDCLFEDVDGHWCADKFGQPAKPGGCCHVSAQLMGRKDFASRYPGLHAKAVLLHIIEVA